MIREENVLSISKVVTFEATPKFWGIEDWRKGRKDRTLWTIIKDFPVVIDGMARYSFSIGFCGLSSSCCYKIVASSPSLGIICSFSPMFCTSSSSSFCSVKVSWAYLGELIQHLFGTDLLRSIFDRQFQKFVILVLQQCIKYCVVIGGRSKCFIDRCPYMRVFAVWV